MVGCQWDRTVLLHDGSPVSSSSEAWRAECEARLVLRLDVGRQRSFLQLVGERRGPDAAARLKQAMYVVEPAFVLSLATKDARRAYLARAEADRGLQARTHLEERARAIWKSSQPTEGAA